MIVDMFAIAFATALALGKQPENYHAVLAKSFEKTSLARLGKEANRDAFSFMRERRPKSINKTKNNLLYM